MNQLKLFTTGFLQVFFVSANTYFLAREQYMGVSMASFMISFIWSYNVKKVAFGGFWDKIIYSLGATTGALLGLFISKNIINNL
ncbi:MAG: hypothetical protein Q4A00_05690 [Flavobacteriaceae bacterium]|nr:hypothetical protein [Flavobacteriaceae bacterium]